MRWSHDSRQRCMLVGSIPTLGLMKKVLDVCCGGKMFWFNKNNPHVVYNDNRIVDRQVFPRHSGFRITPDNVMDFTNMDYEDESFSLVVFDPPHLVRAGPKSFLRMKYGVLDEDWQSQLSKGFKECFRVLKQDGVLVFKWNEDQVSLQDVLSLAEYEPMFGHTTGRSGKTKWVTFMKT